LQGATWHPSWEALGACVVFVACAVGITAVWEHLGDAVTDLASLQTVVQVVTIVLAGVVAAVPREKGPLELAALTAAVLLGVQLSLTHWFYLYLPWVLPFALLAVLAPRTRPAGEA